MSFNFDDCWYRIQNGDEKALEELFREINKSLILYSLNITKDLFASQELIQDLFLKIWQNRMKIYIKGSLKSYLYNTAHNFSVNFIVRQHTLKFSVNKLVPEEAWLSMENKMDVNDFLIEKLEKEDTERIVEKAIAELPEQCRKIFKLSRYEGRSIDEIATAFNISPNTVRTHIYRALEKIRSDLEKNF